MIRLSNRKTHHIAGETAIMDGERKLQMVLDGRILLELTGGEGTGEKELLDVARKLNLSDANKITASVVAAGGGKSLELAYPIRLPASVRYALAPAAAADPTSRFTPFAVLPVAGADGLARARLPLAGNMGFLRLQSTLVP